MPRTRIIAINILIFISIVVVIELLLSATFYYRTDEGLAIVKFADRIKEKVFPTPVVKTKTKLEIIREFRNSGIEAYPSYLYNPQLHDNTGKYYLSNLPNAKLVFCNETASDSGWTVFDSDEIGFRNPKNQIGKSVEYIFLGDSYTEGACVNDGYTIADLFRREGHSVLNLGRVGTGPLAQLGILREYGKAVQGKNLLWFIFTGNDLMNLREEKTSKLINYLNRDYTQDLINDPGLTEQMKVFLNKRIQNQMLRDSLEKPFYDNTTLFGESLDEMEAQEELILFGKICDEIVYESNKQGLKLTIVLINYYDKGYPLWIQSKTSDFINNYAKEKEIFHIEFTGSYLEEHVDSLYPCCGSHFSESGYLMIGKQIFEKVHNRTPN